MSHDVLTKVLTEAAIRARAAERVRELGPNAAAREFGMSREAILSLAAGAPVTRGTLAVAREHMRRDDRNPHEAA
jgi:hypothetical protein